MKIKLIAAIIAACIIFPCLSWTLSPAFALAEEAIDVSNYTDVLEDLQKDESFDASQYPAIPGDYGIEVFQIAESSDGELFVYVYQHSVDVLCHATSVNISTTVGENYHFSNYKLQLLNENGTLAKYLVRDLKVSNLMVRYYEISSIYRGWSAAIGDKDVDKTTENKISEVAFKVGKLYTVVTYEGETQITEEHRETIEIKDYYVGNLLFLNGASGFFNVTASMSTVHYVAFSTDHRIDTLTGAYVGFNLENWTYDNSNYVTALKELKSGKWYEKVSFSEPVWTETRVYDEKAQNKPLGSFFAHTYQWDCVSDVKTFIKNSDVAFSDEAIVKLQSLQWVLVFREQEIVAEGNAFSGISMEGANVSDVTILQLDFITNGNSYQMGVVSNKQTGSGNPDNTNYTPWDNMMANWNDFVKNWNDFWNGVGNFFAEYWIRFAIAGGVILLSIVLAILDTHFPCVGKSIKVGLKWFGLGIYYVVSALPRLVVLIGEKIKERREAQTN